MMRKRKPYADRAAEIRQQMAGLHSEAASLCMQISDKWKEKAQRAAFTGLPIVYPLEQRLRAIKHRLSSLRSELQGLTNEPS